MFRDLPSPNALRTFESAARLGSFKAAAEELYVTPTAVSHQIRSLENVLGIALFLRGIRQVELTEEGKRLAPALLRAFLEMKSAVEQIVETGHTITVSTTPAFALLRLVPELPLFYQQAAGINIQIDTATTPVNLSQNQRVDVAIRYGISPHSELMNIPLIREHFGAYVSPSSGIERISNLTVLLETQWQQPILQEVNWNTWLKAAGIPAGEGQRTVYFDEEHYVLQAAIAGQGVALASSALTTDMVARNLLRPIYESVRLPGSMYTLLCIAAKARSPFVKQFLDWAVDRFADESAS